MIEYKSKSLRDSILQLYETAQQLKDMQRLVNHAIIIAEGIDDPERNLYRKQGNTLIYKLTRKSVTIQTGNGLIDVEIFDLYEIDRQYKEVKRTPRLWEFK